MSILKYFLFSLICLLSCSVVFAANEITVDSMTSVYDENSGVIVTEENGEHSVIFNDKDQSVKYNIVLKNNTNKDIPIENLSLPKPTEDFLKYELTGLNGGDVIKANSTKDVVISLETVKTEGWGRNFDIVLTSEVSLDSSVLNPNTNDFVAILFILSIVFGCSVFVLKNKKVARYGILIIGFFSVVPYINADKVYMVPIKINVSFESQNIMKANSCYLDEKYYLITGCGDYWDYRESIKEIYIENEFNTIDNYEYKFDVSENNNGKVIGYLVPNELDADFYNLYLQSDGVIYFNENSNYYFAQMRNLTNIGNLAGVDTSRVTNMSSMFEETGMDSVGLSLDLSIFDTSNVTDMSYMFNSAGFSDENFVIDLSSFDTSNVVDMRAMFFQTGYYSKKLELDLSNFDTNKVTNMSSMFAHVGIYNPEFTLDLSKFDTSYVTDMSYMFDHTGFCSIDLSNFDTSNVTDMSFMFEETGYNCASFTLDVSNFDTSNVTNMSGMFSQTGYNSEIFNIDTSNFDMSKVNAAYSMFNGAGYNSSKLNTTITINKNNFADTYDYAYMFNNVAIKPGTSIILNYTKDTESLVDKMIATKTVGANVVKGKMIVDIDNLSIGDEIHISGEKFNVISQNDDSVSLFAQYNLGSNYKQTSNEHYVVFSDKSGWEYTPGPKEIDVQVWGTYVSEYINEYVDYFNRELNTNSVTGDLLTLFDLKDLGCNINENYSKQVNAVCVDSLNYSWLITSQSWWTKSAVAYTHDQIWKITSDGSCYANYYTDAFDTTNGVRPVITISKEALKNYLKT